MARSLDFDVLDVLDGHKDVVLGALQVSLHLAASAFRGTCRWWKSGRQLLDFSVVTLIKIQL